MRIRIASVGLTLLLTGATLLNAVAAEQNVFQESMESSEAIRLSLVKDSMTGVAEQAEAIEHRLGDRAEMENRL